MSKPEQFTSWELQRRIPDWLNLWMIIANQNAYYEAIKKDPHRNCKPGNHCCDLVPANFGIPKAKNEKNRKNTQETITQNSNTTSQRNRSAAMRSPCIQSELRIKKNLLSMPDKKRREDNGNK